MRVFVTISGLDPRSAKLLYFFLRKYLLSFIATHRTVSDTGSFLVEKKRHRVSPCGYMSKFVLISGSTLPFRGLNQDGNWDCEDCLTCHQLLLFRAKDDTNI